MNKIKFGLWMVLTYFLAQQMVYLLLVHPILYALATLPGTFAHELLHWTSAYIMAGSPQNFDLIPEMTDDGYIQLGSVEFHPSSFNSATVALSPFLLIPSTGAFVALAMRAGTFLKSTMFLYAATCAWCSCIPSRADFSVAFAEPASLPIAVVILGSITILIFLGLRKALRTVQ